MLPPNQKWSEFIRVVDDPFWDGMRNLLVAFFAIGSNFTPKFLGTGFVIGASPDGLLLVLTAKHVVEDGAIQVQRQNRHRSGNSASILFEPDKPDISDEALRAVWMGSSDVDIMFIRHVAYANKLDVAVCVIEPQDSMRDKVAGKVPVICLDTEFPPVGSTVHIVSLASLKFENRNENGDMAGPWYIESRPVVRVGTVLSHEEMGMGHFAPLFTTSIPVDAGMSGGFAYVPRDGQPIAACGIVSAADEADDGQTRFNISGHSSIVGILGALALQVPTSIEPTYTLLFDLVKAGALRDVADAEKLEIRFDETGEPREVSRKE